MTIFKRNDLNINEETPEVVFTKDNQFRKLSNNLFVALSDYQEIFESHKQRMLKIKKDMSNFSQIIHTACIQSCLEKGVLVNRNKY